MPTLFISYRRHDTADITGRLHDRLKAHFGDESVFMDIDSIPFGLDFRTQIGNAVSQCDILLAVIGEGWLAASFDKGPKKGMPRLQDLDDYVRIEIEAALSRGIPVIPVVVGHAEMPSTEELPDGLKELSYRNAAVVRSEQDFNIHVDRLIRGLEKLTEKNRQTKAGMEHANLVAAVDNEMAVVRARKLVESLIQEMYERRFNEPPGTRRLASLVDRLVNAGHFPERFSAATTADGNRFLSQLMDVVKWYMEVEQPNAIGQLKAHRPTKAEPVAHSASRSEVVIVPKGLRSFDSTDADFFLELLPGPFNNGGLPASIAFWKHRIENADECAFTVGVIYGPSGCGKSSLVKAGLLPRLADQILSVYVEANADDTETRLLNGLRRKLSDLPHDLDLKGSIAALRQGNGLSQGQKVLLILDQCEQWLHANRGGEDAELVQALRQCDGEHVQCVILVRDDFWLALSHFMNDLHIELLQGQNLILVDLFDPIHARKVLLKFGRAYERVDETPSNEQGLFLDQAIASLAKDGWVICVRLALFAQMMKGRQWTPTALKEVGGIEGVGVTFLEETFVSPKANPKHRLHQNAARAVLSALLPEYGTEIKGHMRSHGELLEASGYSNRPKDFDGLIQILNSEVRLVIPTDPEGKEEATLNVRSGQKYYQLTHDYLVPSLRDWLTRRQQETRRGQAELLLADRAAVWKDRPENRQLPSLLQWIQICWWTHKKNWTQPQLTMMTTARNYHIVQAIWSAVLLIGLVCMAILFRIDSLAQTLEHAEFAEVPYILKSIRSYGIFADPILQVHLGINDERSPERLRIALALLERDNRQVSYIGKRLLEAEPSQIPIVCKALNPHKSEIQEQLWNDLKSPTSRSQWMKAAAALAQLDSENKQWDSLSDDVANELIKVSSTELYWWMELFRPVSKRLLPRLSYLCHSVVVPVWERALAIVVLADYASDDPTTLSNALMDADVNQFDSLFPKLKNLSQWAIPILLGEIDKKLSDDVPSSDKSREKLAKRQANAAVALLRLDQSAKVWKLLEFHPEYTNPATGDPRVRSYFIHRMGLLGVDSTVAIKQLDGMPDITMLRALLLSLGGFNEQALSLEQRMKLIPQMQAIYRTHPDPGVHGAAEWLLRQWRQNEWLKQAQAELKTEPRLADIEKQLASPVTSAAISPQWYVNSQGQTLVVIPGPVEFIMGSPTTEEDRDSSEKQHKRSIRRTFAIADKHVTWDDYLKYAPNEVSRREAQYSPTLECPANFVSWFRAAEYCNWLSRQEGVAEVYEIVGEKTAKLRENYLSLAGYRLPTEAEMEYAVRAGTITSRYYGETDELLGKYATYEANVSLRSQPVGSLKPNDWGLFDLQGNLFAWCQDAYTKYPEQQTDAAVEDREAAELAVSDGPRVLRGGAFDYRSKYVRSAYRTFALPLTSSYGAGFRLARTLPP